MSKSIYNKMKSYYNASMGTEFSEDNAKNISTIHCLIDYFKGINKYEKLISEKETKELHKYKQNILDSIASEGELKNKKDKHLNKKIEKLFFYDLKNNVLSYMSIMKSLYYSCL